MAEQKKTGTMKVKPWGQDQGDFVVIDAEDFDPAFHEEFAEPAPEKPAKPAKGAKASE